MKAHGMTIEPVAVSLKRAAVLSGLSERSLRYYVASRRLRVCHAGRKLLVPMSSLREFVETPQHPSPTELQDGKGKGES